MNDEHKQAWLSVLRWYGIALVFANLGWEIAQLPLYTIWAEGSLAELAFAVVHCTLGDLLIAYLSLVIALLVVGADEWPVRRFASVATVAVVIGVGYTIYSEWLNISVRNSWAYSSLMPVVPWIQTGLSPLAQWIVIPSVGLWWARRLALRAA
jgi:hypothetical protein